MLRSGAEGNSSAGARISNRGMPIIGSAKSVEQFSVLEPGHLYTERIAA